MAENPENLPNHPSPGHKRQQEGWKLCSDLYEGPRKVRDRGVEYLPKFPREPDEKYLARLRGSVLYEWFARTVRGLTGMVFREPPALAESLPPSIRQAWEDLDLLGSHGRVFWRDRHAEAQVLGHLVVFVDMSTALRRPYCVAIRADDVLDGLYDEVDGRPTLVHFRYRARVLRRKGRYGYREVETVREYNLRQRPDGVRYVECLVHERQEDTEGRPKDEWVTTETRAMEIDEIPAVTAYHGDRLGPFESRPPHEALAEENIKHYNLVSDNDNVLHLCSVPQFAVIGADRTSGTQKVAANAGWDLPKDGKIMYAEPQGNGLEAAERRIAASERRMALLGLSMLHSESRAAETATSKQIDKAESDSQIASHASATNDAIEESVRLMAKWLDLELTKDGGRWVAVNQDFVGAPLEPQVMMAYAKLWEGGLPVRPILEELQRGGRLPKDADLDAIEMQVLMGAELQAERRRSEAAAQEAVA